MILFRYNRLLPSLIILILFKYNIFSLVNYYFGDTQNCYDILLNVLYTNPVVFDQNHAVRLYQFSYYHLFVTGRFIKHENYKMNLNLSLLKIYYYLRLNVLNSYINYIYFLVISRTKFPMTLQNS